MIHKDSTQTRHLDPPVADECPLSGSYRHSTDDKYCYSEKGCLCSPQEYGPVPLVPIENIEGNVVREEHQYKQARQVTKEPHPTTDKGMNTRLVSCTKWQYRAA